MGGTPDNKRREALGNCASVLSKLRKAVVWHVSSPPVSPGLLDTVLRSNLPIPLSRVDLVS